MTNLFDAVRFPAAIIGDLYHQRWRIEEAFKRIKHRLALVHVTGLSQVAVARYLAAKILCDNIHSLLSQAAQVHGDENLLMSRLLKWGGLEFAPIAAEKLSIRFRDLHNPKRVYQSNWPINTISRPKNTISK